MVKSARWLLLFLAGPALAQQVSYDSGAVPVEVTLGAGTLNSGNALGLFTIPVARVNGGAGIITKIIWKSVNGDGTAKVAKMWDAKPVNTTCTNGSAFVGSDTDDAWLIAGATQLTWTPAAPSVTTGDTAFYYEFTGLTISYHNHDGAPIPTGAGVGTNNGIASSQNVYLCVIAGASDTLDVSHAVRVTVSGPQD